MPSFLSLQEQLTGLFKFSEEVALKPLHHTFFHSPVNNKHCASRPASSWVHPSAAKQLQHQQGASLSCHGIEADGHSVTSLAGNTIITSHIHLKTGTDT